MTTKAATKGDSHIGSDFDELLREEKVYDEAQAIAVKRVLAFEFKRGMQKAQLIKTAMAKRMGTTRAQLALTMKGLPMVSWRPAMQEGQFARS